MPNELVDAVRSLLTQIEFPFENLPRKWAERTPKVVLALAGVAPSSQLSSAVGWGDINCPVLTSREIIGVLNRDWGENISSGSYDEVRRKCVTFLVEAGVAAKNPDDPEKAPNSPKSGYAISGEFAALLRLWDHENLASAVSDFVEAAPSLRAALRNERKMLMVPVQLPDGKSLDLSPGAHNELQRDIVEKFLPRYAPGCELIYLGDALDRSLYKSDALMKEVGLFDLERGELPDVVVLDRDRSWLLLIEAVATSGHMSPLRHHKLKELLANAKFPSVYVTSFPDKSTYAKSAADIAWETEVWIATDPTHLIHYDGERYLGPYE